MKITTTIAGLVLMMSQGEVWGADPGPSASVGDVGRGRLVHPAVLAGNAMMRVNERTNFGTTELVSVIVKAVAAVNLRFPKTPLVTVGDLSKDGGGFLSGHQSHQAGRDADIGFYMADGRSRKEFDKATPMTIDAGRMWTLLASLLDSGELEYAFIAYPLQRPIYEYARDVAKVPLAKLDRYFQYPRKVSERAGIIRHIPNHDNHLHIRVFASRSVARGGAWAAAREPPTRGAGVASRLASPGRITGRRAR